MRRSRYPPGITIANPNPTQAHHPHPQQSYQRSERSQPHDRIIPRDRANPKTRNDIFTVYSQPHCGHCIRAIEILKHAKVNFQVKQVSDVRQLPPGSDGTTPQVTINGKLIGGVQKLYQFLFGQPDLSQLKHEYQNHTPSETGEQEFEDTGEDVYDGTWE